MEGLTAYSSFHSVRSFAYTTDTHDGTSIIQQQCLRSVPASIFIFSFSCVSPHSHLSSTVFSTNHTRFKVLTPTRLDTSRGSSKFQPPHAVFVFVHSFVSRFFFGFYTWHVIFFNLFSCLFGLMPPHPGCVFCTAPQCHRTRRSVVHAVDVVLADLNLLALLRQKRLDDVADGHHALHLGTSAAVEQGAASDT